MNIEMMIEQIERLYCVVARLCPGVRTRGGIPLTERIEGTLLRVDPRTGGWFFSFRTASEHLDEVTRALARTRLAYACEELADAATTVAFPHLLVTYPAETSVRFARERLDSLWTPEDDVALSALRQRTEEFRTERERVASGEDCADFERRFAQMMGDHGR